MTYQDADPPGILGTAAHEAHAEHLHQGTMHRRGHQ